MNEQGSLLNYFSYETLQLQSKQNLYTLEYSVIIHQQYHNLQLTTKKAENYCQIQLLVNSPKTMTYNE